MLFDQIFNDFALTGSGGEYTAYVGISAELVMRDHFAASVVDYVEAELAISLVGLVECSVAVSASKLKKKKIIIIIY